MAACIGQSLVKQNSVLLENRSRGGGAWEEQGGVYLRPAANPLCQGLCLPLPAPDPGLLFPCQILQTAGEPAG